jgi:hypothetical protein
MQRLLATALLVTLSALPQFACDGPGPPVGDADAGGPVTALTQEQLMDPRTCQGCHPAHYEEWRGSMHAYASQDPVFHAMNQKGQQETAGALGDFCVGCHAPLATRLGLTQDGLNLAELPSAVQGVGCYVCHAVSHVDRLDNNGLRLISDGKLRGGIERPVATPAHGSLASPLHATNDLQSATLCGACHDVRTAAGVHLERTFVEWRDSLFGSNSREHGGQLSCNACHMPSRVGRAAVGVNALPERVLHDHRFPAVDVALTPFPGSTATDQAIAREQRERVQGLLDTSLGVEICVQPLSQGRAAVFVTLENASAGHRWPSGAAQDRRAWVQVRAYRDDAEPFWTSGIDLPGSTGAETDANRWGLQDRLFDEQGREVHSFWEAREIEQHTLPAPVTRDPSSRDFLVSHVTRRYPLDPMQTLPAEPSRVEVLVRLQPIGEDILDGLVEEGYLAREIANAMPVFDLIPNRHLADHPTLSRLAETTFEWSAETLAFDGFAKRTLNDEAFAKHCVRLAPPR